MNTTVRHRVERLAGWGLEVDPTPMAGAPDEPHDGPLGVDSWSEMLASVIGERLTGPLAWAIAEGSWPADDRQRDEAYAAHRASMATTLVLERRLLELGALFDEHAVSYRVLKGSAVARLDEADPSLRSFGDLDLLITDGGIERARDLLVARGGRRRYPEPRAGFDRRFGKGLCVVLDNGHEIDLHRTLTPGPFGLTVDLDQLAESAQTFELGGQHLPALCSSHRFVHACLHAVLGSTAAPLSQYRDIAVTCPGPVNELVDALAAAEEWQAGIVVQHAVRDTVTRLGWRPPAALQSWADAYRPTRVEERRLAAYRKPDASVAKGIGSIGAVHGLRNKVAFGLALALPERGKSVRPRPERVRRGLGTLTKRGER